MSINKAKTRHKNALFTGVITGNKMDIIDENYGNEC